jgi:DNA-binding CsgD family transcriptional regulator
VSHSVSTLRVIREPAVAAPANGIAAWPVRGPEEELSELVAEIYDAALDGQRWPAVLGQIAEFTGAQVAGLLSKDSVSRAGNVHYDHGTAASYLESYRQTYWRYDPLSPLLFFDAGEVVVATEQMTEQEFREGKFYREWLKPQGWIDCANVVLDKSTTSLAILSLVRKAPYGPVDAEMLRRVNLLVPHVQRAVLIGRLVDLKTGQADTFADIFDQLSAGMFLLDQAGTIVHANRPGTALLADRSVVAPQRGKLIVHDTKAARELDAGLKFVRENAGALSIPMASLDDRRYLAHLLPLTDGIRRRAGVNYAAVAALFVHPAALEAPAAPALIAKSFGLTMAELRVMMAIVNIGGVPETAEALGIAESTTKTHLQRIFAKTGTSRQADLVRLVAGHAGPLAALPGRDRSAHAREAEA